MEVSRIFSEEPKNLSNLIASMTDEPNGFKRHATVGKVLNKRLKRNYTAVH